MSSKSVQKICLVPKLVGLGGTASFQSRLANELGRRGVAITYDLQDPEVGVVLVVGGTRSLRALSAARGRGALIVQRLGGINWVHRKRYTGIRHFLRSEINNRLIATIRNCLADRFVYQSRFVQDWWREYSGDPGKPAFVIHNGVDLSVYTPQGPGILPTDHYRLLLVEGRLGGGYHMGLENAVELTHQLKERHGLMVELRVVGEVPSDLKKRMTQTSHIPIEWLGVVRRDAIPELDRSAHALFSADLNAACPNAVIEALACGLPVVAFDTGALKELVPVEAGSLSAYGSDVWRLEKPDVAGLADASIDVFKNNSAHRRAARKYAEEHFRLERMVDSYCEVWGSI
jgi:glycosyltransferase involved in cell wall biosynthesis